MPLSMNFITNRDRSVILSPYKDYAKRLCVRDEPPAVRPSGGIRPQSVTQHSSGDMCSGRLRIAPPMLTGQEGGVIRSQIKTRGHRLMSKLELRSRPGSCGATLRVCVSRNRACDSHRGANHQPSHCRHRNSAARVVARNSPSRQMLFHTETTGGTGAGKQPSIGPSRRRGARRESHGKPSN
jgi:hypothetical protein